MASDGMQITIPDFDDTDYSSTTSSFGRAATGGGSAFGHGFGGGSGFGSAGFGAAANFGGASGSGQDSPTQSTPLAGLERSDKSYFTAHNRGDSIASVDSASSIATRFTTKTNPFSHASQPSTGSSPFTKKPSFASIRNAFKGGGKTPEAPPVPHIDHQAYPVLKNPFNRSTSSLNQTPTSSSRGTTSASTTTSPPYARPQTPLTEAKFGRSASTKPRSHAYAMSTHSHSGSIFHSSDAGSDFANASHYSPPPVPRVPNALFGSRSETPDLDEDKVVMDPKTPSDYALHAVFMRFASSAELKINSFLQQNIDLDPSLLESMGPTVDSKFDETLQSLGKIAQKQSKAVVDSIMRWRRSQHDPVNSEIISSHLSSNNGQARSARAQEVPSLLYERKSLASIYIMCRALIAVLQSISKDALGETLGYSLEETTFEQFRRPDLKLLAQSANHRVNAELYATLLGYLANIRFETVTDRFLAELGPVASGQVPKDLDMKYENLVKGLKHVTIKVWPPELFESGAEFLESLSKSFSNAHGLRLKTAFAEALLHLLHPIGKTAQAETNNPQWAKAIELIYPKAKEMVSKPRYWQAAYPLMVTSLCVAPQSFFLKHWLACFENGASKLKEKPHRIPVLNAMIRLIWTYLYRCQESASTTTSKLDGALKHFFPSHRSSGYPHEDVQPFVLIVHFILSRHFEYGRDLCLDLMQESAVKTAQQSGNLASILSPERTTIATQAILLSLHGIEREEATPAWPSSMDFSTVPSWDDYPTSSEFVPPSLSAKPGIQDLLDKCCATLDTIAISCGNAVGSMSVLDEQWSYAKLNPAYEESHNYVIRRHGDHAIAYPTHFVAQISMLQCCFQAWPRCLGSSISVVDAVDLLFRGVIHVEPLLAEVASDAIKRFMNDPQQALIVLGRFTSFLFNPTSISREGTGPRILVEAPQLLDLWVLVVEGWIRKLTQPSKTSLAEDETIRCAEIEAGALFLLGQEKWAIHSAGVRVIRLLGLWVQHVAPGALVPSDPPATSLRFVELLLGRGEDKQYLHGYDELLEKLELLRLEQWRQSKRVDVPLRMADSNNEKDRKLWRYVYPSLLQHATNNSSQVLSSLRETLVAAVSRYLPYISHLAGLSSRVPPGMPSRSTQGLERDGQKLVRENKLLVDQWYIWIKILCATATLSESSRPVLTQLGREHSRAPSDATFERERLSTTRGLFRYLTPFLDSEYTQFRDAAVLCISSFPPSGYPQLLEDLSLLAGRQFYDDQRSKPSSAHSDRPPHDDPRSKSGLMVSVERSRRQERLHSAVARIYYLTSPYLQHTRAAGRHAALSNVLKFVRNTQTFLLSPEMRDNPSLQRLRRYFCGIVERLFDGLASLKDSDRFIPPNMHLMLYRLCEDWCEIGPQSDSAKQRLIRMQRAAASSSQESSDAAERFQIETMILSNATIGALASLCQKAYYPPELASNSPTERSSPEYLKPLTPAGVMDRLIAILSVSHQPTVTRGKKALKSLLAHKPSEINLVEESLKRAAMIGESLNSSSGCFFQVVADIVCTSESHPFTFAQVVFVGLSNLSHPLPEVRRSAFNMLEAIHQQSSGLLSMAQFEPMVCSQAHPTYIYAHRLVSDFLAGEHPSAAFEILAQIAMSLPKTKPRNPLSVLLLLQSLEFWMPNINLQSKDGSETVSREGSSALYHLMVLTVQYAPSHTEQLLMLWTKLVEPPHERNSHFATLFLLQQSVKVGTIDFVKCSAAIIACLCQTGLGKKIFSELCSLIDPFRMLPQHEHKLAFPDAEDMEIWSDLGALFADQPRISLGMAQYSWLFLADVALQRQWEFQSELPVLLHAVFTHVDHRIVFVREQARRMLFQVLRGWMPGYGELSERGAHSNRASLKAIVSQLDQDGESAFWKEDEAGPEVEPKMKKLCATVLQLLEPLAPHLAERWASLALSWGTTCSIRSTAFRSLQIFRAVVPYASKTDVAQLLGRLSNTISSSDDKLQPFSLEIILTLKTLTSSPNLDRALVPQLFWCSLAALSTTDLLEFTEALQLFEAVLDQINLDADTEPLLSHQPPHWKDNAYLQRSLLAGLRSSSTYNATFKLLQRLSKGDDDRLVDSSGGRVRDLYTICLPWCLHAMATESVTDSLKEFVANVARLAKREGKHNIHKILNSFAKGHFRTKDDFLRQSVSSLRDYFGDQWPQIDTILLGFLLNNERWLRVYTMQILKVLFQQRVSRNPSERLGSEVLMPLLRLLENDLASNALDVLEEPLTISGGGPPAKHVLRMSMHAPTHNKLNPVAVAFGVPDETGWCIAQAESLRETCRHNIMAVFDTCSVPSRPSLIDFEPEMKFETTAQLATEDEDLGGLVQNLHELTAFFQDEDNTTKVHTPLPMPDRRLEARVAAILAKSTAIDAVTDVPQTPFLDVFRVSTILNHDDSSDYSDSDSDDDENPFIFDSPSFFRPIPQSSGYH
ncbi:hypothetical protein HGRIS_000531 [Hohenbuehelia grisea]|uniref:Uncharacterized protein n=1 Tax=Hohenbuehelia grisea TaxID=104357 RepID=A0ABR3JRY6_9AGAR